MRLRHSASNAHTYRLSVFKEPRLAEASANPSKALEPCSAKTAILARFEKACQCGEYLTAFRCPDFTRASADRRCGRRHLRVRALGPAVAVRCDLRASERARRSIAPAATRAIVRDRSGSSAASMRERAARPTGAYRSPGCAASRRRSARDASRSCAGPWPSSNSVNAGSPAISPQTLDALAARAGPAAIACAIELQHRRVPGVVEMSHGFVGAVDGERVLDQVVGADRDEIEMAQEHRQHQRGRRDLDHGAESRPRRRRDRHRRAAGAPAPAPRACSAARSGGRPSGSAGGPCRRRWRAGWRAAAAGTSPARTCSSGSLAGRAPG